MMYKTGAVCAATGMSAAKLGRWQDRKTLKTSRHDKVSSGSGDHRLFSRATINRIAIAKRLIDLGIAASPANQAAALFDALYPLGRTLLVLAPTSAQIINVEFIATLTDICVRPFQSAIIVDVGQIMKAVDYALISTKRDI